MANAADSAGAVRFVLDGELIELENVEPTRTVLQLLREDLGRTGTKEGCAEGDCGACTVVVAEIDRSGEDLAVRAINSCIRFVPTLDGKELITVESLGRGGDLHPVQKSMVDCHASQCGFCTPGFVMSLFALYKTRANPSRRQIDDALAGNLCRCTGYRPIVAAAREMYEAPASNADWLRQPCGSEQSPDERVAQLRRVVRQDSLGLQHDGHAYFAPRSVDELAALLARCGDATLLAGGTDVGLWVTKQHRRLQTIIYTGEVEGLDRVEITATHLEIGAAATLADAVPPILEHYPLLEELFVRFASPPIRNAATLGGNIANGSPIGDSMPALMAAGTTLVLRSQAGAREVPLDDFYHDNQQNDLGQNDLGAGEFIERIRIPLPRPTTSLRSYKISKRFDQDISAVCTACLLELEDDTVKSIRIACGGLAATVRRAPHCETAMTGRAWSEETVSRGMKAIARDFEPISDMRASAGYRLRCAQNLLMRLYRESRGEPTVTVYSYGRQG